MKVTLENTSKLVMLCIDGNDVPARIWEGVTEKGVRCHAYITRIAVHQDDDAAEFDRDLIETIPPSPEVAAIPVRLIV